MMQKTENNREWVSALADGQLHGQEFTRALDWLGAADDARLTWHAYHVVGDVLRSGEAMASGRDHAFMQRLQLSLQQEAPLIGPTAAAPVTLTKVRGGLGGIDGPQDRAANDSRFRWKLLAGVASLALVSVISWQASSGWDRQRGDPQLAQLPTPARQTALALSPAVAVAGAEAGVMIRDPQLDALLAAHRQFGGISALQMPAGFLRNATFDGVDR